MTISFKDLMAAIPTCVGVIIYKMDDYLGACTISSFVSVSVESGDETVMFTLKQGSRTGESLMAVTKFSVCILNSEQQNFARLGGTNLSRDEIQDKLIDKVAWTPEGIPFLSESHMCFDLQLQQRVKVGQSDIYLCKVLSSRSNIHLSKAPMIYVNRKFTKHQEVND